MGYCSASAVSDAEEKQLAEEKAAKMLQRKQVEKIDKIIQNTDSIEPQAAELKRIADAAKAVAEAAERLAQTAQQQAEQAKKDAEQAGTDAKTAKRQSRISNWIAGIAAFFALLPWLFPDGFRSVLSFFGF